MAHIIMVWEKLLGGEVGEGVEERVLLSKVMNCRLPDASADVGVGMGVPTRPAPSPKRSSVENKVPHVARI